MRTFTAQSFAGPMAVGINRPFLVEGIDESEDRQTIVVKSNAGYAEHGGTEAMHREAFSLLLARKLGLEAVEPVVVNFLPGFEYGAASHTEYENRRGIKINFEELVANSYGLNFGTIHLGNGWNPWDQGRPSKAIAKSSMSNAFAFDALVQNPDRKTDNPNLLWKNSELALLDFDQAWIMGFNPQEARPWRRPLDLMNLKNHCLYPSLKPPTKADKYFGVELHSSLSEKELHEISKNCAQEVESHFSGANIDFQELLPYTKKLARNLDDFFGYLTEKALK